MCYGRHLRMSFIYVVVIDHTVYGISTQGRNLLKLCTKKLSKTFIVIVFKIVKRLFVADFSRDFLFILRSYIFGIFMIVLVIFLLLLFFFYSRVYLFNFVIFFVIFLKVYQIQSSDLVLVRNVLVLMCRAATIYAYSYIRVLPDEFLLKSTVMTTDFKRNSSGRTRIYEYPPPPSN